MRRCAGVVEEPAGAVTVTASPEAVAAARSVEAVADLVVMPARTRH